MDRMVRVETVLDSWRAVRQDSAQAVEDFPADELDFRPAPDLMTFREIARHILDAGHALTGLVLAGEENLADPEVFQRRKGFVPRVPEQMDAGTMAAELRKCADERVSELKARDAEWFAHEITRFDGQRVTRLEMMQFVKEHELTHRSQLFLYLRLKGIVPATTRRRLAKSAK
jgi:uncharacterized damage-inducible protein DinB